MNDIKRCSKCQIEFLKITLYYKEDFQNYRNECKQCMTKR